VAAAVAVAATAAAAAVADGIDPSTETVHSTSAEAEDDLLGFRVFVFMVG